MLSGRCLLSSTLGNRVWLLAMTGCVSFRQGHGCQTLGSGLVTTEKDAARLPPAWRDRVAAWPVRVRFDDPAALDGLLARATGR